MLVYRGYTGQWPWEDKRARLFQIPLNDADRDTPLAKRLWGDSSKTAYVNLFGWSNPLVQRGASALGIKGGVDTLLAGGSPGQAIEKAKLGPINAGLHLMFSAPAAHALAVGATGNDLYMTADRDSLTGQPGMQFLKAVPKDTPAGQTLTNIRYGAAHVNPFIKMLLEKSGAIEDPFHNAKESSDAEADPWIRMAFDLGVPRLIGRAEDTAATTKRLEKAEKAADRPAGMGRGMHLHP
jgi:hypothetical protein